MARGLFIVAAALLVAGVARADDPKPKQDPESTPVCKSERKCAAMWDAAADAVGLVSGMRNRIVTETRIETFPAIKVSTMTGIVSRVPVGDGYEIRIQLECYRGRDSCSSIRPQGERLFNVQVNGAGLRFED